MFVDLICYIHPDDAHAHSSAEGGKYSHSSPAAGVVAHAATTTTSAALQVSTVADKVETTV